jgi:hypothetical protein
LQTPTRAQHKSQGKGKTMRSKMDIIGWEEKSFGVDYNVDIMRMQRNDIERKHSLDQ